MNFYEKQNKEKQVKDNKKNDLKYYRRTSEKISCEMK